MKAILFHILLFISFSNLISQPLHFVFGFHNYPNDSAIELDFQRCISALENISPYNEFLDQIIIRKVIVDSVVCTVRTQDRLYPQLYCQFDRDNLSKSFGGRNYKFILLSHNHFASWGELTEKVPSFVYLSTLNKSEQNLQGELIHELGHAFGLRDEYAPLFAKHRSIARTEGPNCVSTIEKAEELWGHLWGKGKPEIGYYKGCAGYKDYIKPSRNSIMGTTSYYPGGYNLVGEEHIRQVLEELIEK